MLGIFAFLEALFKRRVQNFISNFVVGLALVTMLVLVVKFFKPVLVVLALLTGLLIIIDNARELRSS
jgi:chromate transport protein ChrA